MVWHPVRPEALERAAEELRRRPATSAPVTGVPASLPEMERLAEADARLAEFVAGATWAYLLALAADIQGRPVQELSLPPLWVDRATEGADWSWELRRSRGRAEVLVDLGPMVRVIEVSHSLLGRATRVLAVGAGLLEAARALAPEDHAVGLPALQKVASAVLEGALADLLREALWIAARRELGIS